MDDHAKRSLTYWTQRRVLVTGAEGFVGRWLVAALDEAGAHVFSLLNPISSRGGNRGNTRNPRVELASGNVTDLNYISNLITNSAIDTVYHLAAINVNSGSDVSPYRIFETNIRGVYTILEACRTAPEPVRAIVASSKEVEDCFGPGTDRPYHPYMASKASAELVARAYSDTFGLSVTVVRSDNLYGGGDFNWNRLVPGTIRSIFRGERPVIRSNGQFQRDYIYIEDAIAAYLAIGARLEGPSLTGELFWLSGGERSSVLDIVNRIAKEAGRPDLEPLVLNQNSGARIDAPHCPDLEQSVLGWKSKVSLEEGLRRTYQWYSDYFAIGH